MKAKVLWTLVVLNVVLLSAFVLQRMGSTPAHAQAAARRPSEYLMIPGSVSGSPSAFIYVLDTNNGTLGIMSLDNQKRLTSARSIDLNRVFEAAASRDRRR
jgi:hypothetical protein